MKFLSMLAVVCLTVALVGCESTRETGSSSLGAVSECGPNCESDCCPEGAAPGALKEGCSSGKSECSGSGKVCPAAGKTNLGAVSDKPECSSKSSCSKGASLGAVSDKPSCSSAKTSCGNK
ncbi:MAG: hypothetical protein GY715_17725 [Planctomycetes bacterium]|nr:hypothetical protein [Planctomycetota bacterium]